MSSDRFSSIGDLLTSRPAKPATHITPAEQITANDTAPRRPRRPEPKSRESTGGTRRIAFRLDPELHSRLAARAKQTDTSHGNVVLDAIEAAHNDGALADLIVSAQRPPAPAPTSGLFLRTTPREAAAPNITVEIQLQAQAVDQIDTLAEQHHADNRTQLINAALRRYLG